MSTLKNSDMIKGSVIELFLTDPATGSGVSEKVIGFITANTFSVTPNFEEVVTKSHGDYPAQIPTTISWEITTDAVYSVDGMETLLKAALDRTLLTVKFAHVLNYYNGEGIVDNSNADWVANNNYVLAYGKAYISSYTVNANAGENGSISATLTGNGPIESSANGTYEIPTGAPTGPLNSNDQQG